jgi:hypothetical protein
MTRASTICHGSMSILKEGAAMSNSRTFHGDTLYAENEIREVTPSNTKADRGVLFVKRRDNHKGAVVVTLRRRVLVARLREGQANGAAAAASARHQRKLKKFS